MNSSALRDRGSYQADHRKQKQGELQRPRLLFPEGRVPVRDKGADAAHLRAECLNEFQILRQCF